MEKLLPIGSVVLLKNGYKRVMIYGRKQMRNGEEQIWDYIACLYPEGNINPDYAYFFNHDQIDTVFFTGFQDLEELTLIEQMHELPEGDEKSEVKMNQGIAKNQQNTFSSLGISEYSLNTSSEDMQLYFSKVMQSLKAEAVSDTLTGLNRFTNVKVSPTVLARLRSEDKTV